MVHHLFSMVYDKFDHDGCDHSTGSDFAGLIIS